LCIFLTCVFVLHVPGCFCTQGIIHRDIKPDNIAVQRDHTVQLFDWGEALSLSQIGALNDRELAKQAGIAGTPLFMPPEVRRVFLCCRGLRAWALFC
jgi:serine/threonine protein kinase